MKCLRRCSFYFYLVLFLTLLLSFLLPVNAFVDYFEPDYYYLDEVGSKFPIFEDLLSNTISDIGSPINRFFTTPNNSNTLTIALDSTYRHPTEGDIHILEIYMLTGALNINTKPSDNVTNITVPNNTVKYVYSDGFLSSSQVLTNGATFSVQCYGGNVHPIDGNYSYNYFEFSDRILICDKSRQLGGNYKWELPVVENSVETVEFDIVAVWFDGWYLGLSIGIVLLFLVWFVGLIINVFFKVIR